MKKEMIYAIITSNSRKTVVKKLEVKNGAVTYRSCSYDVTSDNFAIYKKLPVYFYDENNKLPHNPITQEVGKYSPAIYNKGLTTKIISELLAVLDGKGQLDFGVLLGIINLILIVGIGVLVVILNKNLVSYLEMLLTKIELFMGGTL